jgi:autotransporter-associated beta strand protein
VRFPRAHTIRRVGLGLAFILWPLFTPAAEWRTPDLTGDWSEPFNWIGVVPSSWEDAKINNGGTAVVNQSGTAYEELTLGGVGGTVNLLSGSLQGRIAYVGSNGVGTLLQDGGAHNLSCLYLGCGTGDTGLYNLGGSGALAATQYEYVGYSGTASFTQSGGTNTMSRLYLSYGAGSNGTYTLVDGQLNAKYEYVGCTGYSDLVTTSSGLLKQSGGLNNVELLFVGDTSTLRLSGGTLQVTRQAVIKGSFDGDGTAGVMTLASNTMTDMSQASIVNTGSTVVNVSANALLILPHGFNPDTAFGFCNGEGIVHIAGNTLVVPAGKGFAGGLSISDPVVCRGSINIRYGDDKLNLRGGLSLVEGGSVDLGDGTLTCNDLNSNISGGTLRTRDQTIGLDGNGVFTQTGGSATVRNWLTLGWNAGDTGVYNLVAGSLTMYDPMTNPNMEIGFRGEGHFVQTGGTVNTIECLITLGSSVGSYGSYTLSGSAVLNSQGQVVGWSGTGIFTHAGGSNSASGLSIGQSATGNGSYNLSESGTLSIASSEYVGYSGAGSFAQSGGTHTVSGGLYLGYDVGSTGTFTLSGNGSLTAGLEYVGYNNAATALFDHTAGSNTTSGLSIGTGGRYRLAGGALTVKEYFVNSGVFKGGSNPSSLTADCLVDLTAGTWGDLGTIAVSMGSKSLLLVPPGFDTSTSFASYSSSGLIHVVGTTLTVPGGKRVGGWGSINDRVICQGTILATAGGAISLNNGVVLATSGQVVLGKGNLTVDDAESAMAGGALSVNNLYIGNAREGRFRQSGGTSTVTGGLYVGCNAGNSGTLDLDGGTLRASGGLYLGYGNGSVGTFNLNGGTLRLSAMSAGSGTPIFNLNGGKLLASATFSTSVPLTLGTSGGGTMVDTSTYTVTLSGAVSGAGSLIKTGTGSLVLDGAKNYTGPTDLRRGTFQLKGTINGAGALVISGGTLFSYAPTANGGTGNSQALAGLYVNSGTSTITAAAGNTLALGPLSRVIGGAVRFNSTTTGTLTTMQPNTNGILGAWATYGSGTSMKYAAVAGASAPYSIAAYTAATPITSGVTGFSDQTGTVNYSLSGSGGTLTGDVTANTLQFTGSATKTLAINSSTALSLNGLMNAGSGTATIAGGKLIVGGTRELVITGSGKVAVDAPIQDNASGPSTVTMSNSYVVTLGGANTHSGGTIATSGTLCVNNPLALGSGPLTITSGATLDNTSGAAIAVGTGNSQVWRGDFTFTGSSALDLGSGPVTLAADSAATVNASNLTVGGVVSGPYSLTKTGAGALTLSGPNTYTGGTVLNGGQVNLGHAAALGTGPLTLNGAGIDNVSGGSLRLSSDLPQTWNSLGFAGTQSLNLGSGPVTLGANCSVTVSANTLIVEGTVSGDYWLVKNGKGTLALAGASDYTGMTRVSLGTLVVDGSLGSPWVTVERLASLRGKGVISGSVVVNKYGHLAPGDEDSIGTLTLLGDLSLDALAYLDFRLGSPSASDMIAMPTATLSLSGQSFSRFGFTALAGFGPGDYVLIDAGAIQGSVGTDVSGTINGLPGTISVVGNDLVLSVVPEPSTWITLVSLLGIGASFRASSRRARRG